MGAAAVEAAQAVGYRRRRHRRVHRRRRERAAARRLLVHGDEHAAAGRASGHRSDHRARSGRMAVPRRRGREAAARRKSDVPLDGHAVEARLYAEDPERGFLPSTGKLLALQFPAGEGIRVDTGVEQGGAITPYYDPMIAKVIAHAPTARSRARPARGRARATPSSPARTPIWRFSRRSAARRSSAPGTSTPASSTGNMADARRRQRRSRGGGVRRGASCWRATSPASARASSARLTRQPRPGTRPTVFSSPAPRVADAADPGRWRAGRSST